MKVQRFVLLSLLVIGGISCKKMRYANMQSMRPAEIDIPSDIKSLVIVNRTKYKSGATNILEGVLTGETPGQDRAAIQAGIYSLQRSLQRSPRFIVKVASEEMLGNSITAALPEPLTWINVKLLTDKYQADAVLAIEVYDTDFVVTNGSEKVKKKVKEGDTYKEVEVTQYFAEGIESVKIGYRLYDPKSQSVIDQDQFKRSNTFRATGSTVQDAAAALISKNEAAKRVTESALSNYAGKIAPMPINISRRFYAKSKKAPSIAIGTRYADVGQWEEAAKTWEQGISMARVKEAGKLSYNVAVANEVLGDMEAARVWAQKAYTMYGEKLARGYISSLDNRLFNEERAQQQMGDGN